MEFIKENLLKMLNSFLDKKVLVLGDIIIDENNYGDAIGLSLDSPVIKLKHKETEISYGGAGNVVKNLLELGAKTSFITLIGDDGFSDFIKNWNHPNLTLFAFSETGRETIVKRRFWGGEYKLLELEHLNIREMTQETIKKVLEIVEREMENYNIIIFQDQVHGFFSKILIEKLKELTKGKKVLVNSQAYLNPPNHMDYKGVHTIFINFDEAKMIDKNFDIENNSNDLVRNLNSNVCITLDNKGSILYTLNGKYFAESIPVRAIDSCGAGDSFLAAFSLCDFEENPDIALKMANIWAGLSTLKKGTNIPKIDELRDYIKYNLNI